MSGIDPAKIAAYQDTDYVVRARQGQFVLRIGQVSQGLQVLYAETGKSTAVFITAFNPEGALQADALNQASHEALRNALSALTGLLFEGEGRGTEDNAGWPAEKSFLALGIDQEESARLGRQFRQDAVVRAGPDGVTELLILR
jgi:hypothetical protein